MSLFVPFKRATLLIPSGPVNDPDRKHLFVLLTDPIEAPGFNGKQVLLVKNKLYWEIGCYFEYVKKY